MRRRSDDEECAPPLSVFTGKGLTVAQVWLANDLLRHAIQSRGPLNGWRRAARIGGIVSAVKGRRAGNARWGRRMRATRAGKARARVGPSLAVVSQRGVTRAC